MFKVFNWRKINSLFSDSDVSQISIAFITKGLWLEIYLATIQPLVAVIENSDFVVTIRPKRLSQSSRDNNSIHFVTKHEIKIIQQRREIKLSGVNR